MHAGFPCLTQEMNDLFRLGAKEGKVQGLLDRVGGTFVAHGMALVLEAGLRVAMRRSLLSRSKARKVDEFFRENFEIRDPDTPGGIRYYQGKILMRTDRPEDDMNVYLRYCPDPDALFRRGFAGIFRKALFGSTLDTGAVVATEVITEEEAEELIKDPEKVDLVISFRDAQAIIGLISASKIDSGQLLLSNIARVTGNIGHLFKFGAIARNIQLELGLN